VRGSPEKLLRVLLTLAIGALGGALAKWAGLPLPWMLGAMMATTAAAIVEVPLGMSMPLRALFVAVLGVMLGSAFTPAILARLNDWALSLLALTAYTAVAGALGVLFFRRVANYDNVTSYFAAMPGGLTEMILVGEAMGGDSRAISLTHGSRIMLVVMALPFAFQLLLGYDAGARPSAGRPLLAVAPLDLVILAACGAAGFFAARALRVPAAPVIGPMVLSAAVHLGGVTAAGPPTELVAAAQVVVGSAIGCRFAGTAPGTVLRAVLWAAGGTAVLLGTAVAFAWGVHHATGLEMAVLTLAYSPGGLAEMSLVALALGLDPAFVATHHIVRIFVIIVAAPLVFRLLRPHPDSHGQRT
jgi:membrane AbrB-like protein